LPDTTVVEGGAAKMLVEMRCLEALPVAPDGATTADPDDIRSLAALFVEDLAG
jgi:hypothetical protein